MAESFQKGHTEGRCVVCGLLTRYAGDGNVICHPWCRKGRDAMIERDALRLRCDALLEFARLAVALADRVDEDDYHGTSRALVAWEAGLQRLSDLGVDL